MNLLCAVLLAKYEMTEEESNEASRVLERQESIEKQQVYEDAFMEQMEKYLQYGELDSELLMYYALGYHSTIMKMTNVMTLFVIDLVNIKSIYLIQYQIRSHCVYCSYICTMICN